MMKHALGMLCGVLISMSLAVASVDADDTASDPEQKKLNGTWQLRSLVVNGSKVSEEVLAKISVTIENGTYTAQIDKVTETGKLSLDTTISPAEMDLQVATGANEGKTLLAIYELTGDTLKICYGPPDAQRPLGLAAPKDSRLLLIELHRQGADE